MKRWQRVALALFIFFTLWYLILQMAPLTESMRSAVVMLPLWLLVSFGSYSLFVIGWRVMTFPECPDAATELQDEMRRASEDLKNKGYIKPERKKTQ